MVDMGKGNLQMGIDDQKITFDLFDAEKHSLKPRLLQTLKVVCVKLVTLKKRLLGGNPTLFFFYLFS